VFLEPGCAVLGFAVVRSDIREEALSKLKIARHPSASIAAATLISKPPTTEAQARQVFEYMTNILGGEFRSRFMLNAVTNQLLDFGSNALQQLKLSNIIPAQTPRSKDLTMVKPGECYFKREDGQASFHSKLFTFVDFGTRANNFLAACGVRNAPTTDEVVRMLIADPHGFYSLAGGADRLVHNVNFFLVY
jgi:hypothetical protein